MTADTIYALSSGSVPAAIGVIRVSGPGAAEVMRAVGGRLPPERRATLAWLRDPLDGRRLDRGLLLWFPGPRTATGEDLAEFHIHGGRAVASAVEAAIAGMAETRRAHPGEFTRRAFANGVIDLAEAEGLADLLAAETESQRRLALDLAGGALSREVEGWRERLVMAAALVEAAIDFSDEADVAESDVAPARQVAASVRDEMVAALARPPAERMRDGIRVVIAGPPNAGKSTLLNRLARREAAIVSNVPGTTRDLIEAPVAIDGVPFLLTDTAGLRESDDPVEAIGVGRAQAAAAGADILIWLGAPEQAPVCAERIMVRAKSDVAVSSDERATYDLTLSARTGEGMDALEQTLTSAASRLLPRVDEVALNRRHREALAEAVSALEDISLPDILLVAESLRSALFNLARLTGRVTVDEVLDTLFGRFCIGK